ncbi:hypothetical protein PEDI_46080 [Persicobacter diffluens]|uniref:Uncharacterized protein n=1 Tax=Persicobacter diffluens TaxID=981 RepID=A0AAN4W1P7_9BACT|nr:hypothetical protein PEDI_46080 [Persicobacter diffluens]
MGFTEIKDFRQPMCRISIHILRRYGVHQVTRTIVVVKREMERLIRLIGYYPPIGFKSKKYS